MCSRCTYRYSILVSIHRGALWISNFIIITSLFLQFQIKYHVPHSRTYRQNIFQKWIDFYAQDFRSLQNTHAANNNNEL